MSPRMNLVFCACCVAGLLCLADDRSFRSRESFRGTTESHVSADIYEATGLEGIENYPVEEDPRELTTFFPFQSMEDRLEKVLYEYLEVWGASMASARGG